MQDTGRRCWSHGGFHGLPELEFEFEFEGGGGLEGVDDSSPGASPSVSDTEEGSARPIRECTTYDCTSTLYPLGYNLESTTISERSRSVACRTSLRGVNVADADAGVEGSETRRAVGSRDLGLSSSSLSSSLGGVVGAGGAGVVVPGVVLGVEVGVGLVLPLAGDDENGSELGGTCEESDPVRLGRVLPGELRKGENVCLPLTARDVRSATADDSADDDDDDGVDDDNDVDDDASARAPSRSIVLLYTRSAGLYFVMIRNRL